MNHKEEVIKILKKIPLPLKFTFDQRINYMVNVCQGKILNQDDFQKMWDLYNTHDDFTKNLDLETFEGYGSLCWCDDYENAPKECLYLDPNTKEYFGMYYNDPSTMIGEAIFDGYYTIEKNDLKLLHDGNEMRFEATYIMFRDVTERMYKAFYEVLVYFNYDK